MKYLLSKTHLFIFNHSRIADVFLYLLKSRHLFEKNDLEKDEKEHDDWFWTIS